MKHAFRFSVVLCLAVILVLGAAGTSAALPVTPPGQFEELFLIPTHSAVDWEFFTIGSDAYLAVANQRYTSWNFTPPSKIYRWDGANFVNSKPSSAMPPPIGSSSPSAAKPILPWRMPEAPPPRFTTGTGRALSQSNLSPARPLPTGSSSPLAATPTSPRGIPGAQTPRFSLEWDELCRIAILQRLPRRDWEFFTIGSQAYLAVANAWGAGIQDLSMERGRALSNSSRSPAMPPQRLGVLHHWQRCLPGVGEYPRTTIP